MTPRRVSIELAPDDSEQFAEGAEELEVRGEVELDLDEASGEPPPWGETEESEQAGEAVDRTERERVRAPVQKQLWRQSRENCLQSDRSAEASLPQSRSRETSFRPLEASLSQDSSRLSRILAESRPPHEPPSLPALPEPDLSQSADDEDNVDTLSSRRAALFRSTSRSSPRQSQSPSLASIRRNQVLETPLQEPIRVGMALVSTPSPSTPKMGNATSTLTPHPPGRWQSSPASVKGNVRFSPLRPPGSTDADRSFGSAHSGDRSIHRLKLSPAKVRSPAKSKSEPAEGDTSFIRRLSRAVTRRPIPQPSTTLSEAQSALARAAEASSIAQIKVERTQRQWLEALASVQNNVAVDVIRKSWGWGTWVWWVGVELLLLWGVFR